MNTTTTKPIDFSSLPEAQQQQLQQLQLQFQEHQQQQQAAAAAAAAKQQEELEQAQQIQQQQYQDYTAAQAYDPSQSQVQAYDPSQVQSAYNPSQVQAYDQSYYAAYYQQYQDPNQNLVQNPQQQQQPQHYGYYQADYANVYQQQPQPQPPHQPAQQQQQHYPQPESAQIHQAADYANVYQQQPHQPDQSQQQPHQPDQSQQQQHYPQPESAQIHQAAVHKPPQPQQQQQYSQPEPAAIHQAVESSRAGPAPVGLGLGQVKVEHQKNAYYPQQVGPGGDQNLGSSVPQGLNPAAAAAVAALSQLTQFAGTMDAAERAMVGLQERQWYGRGGGYGPMMGPGGFPGQFLGPGPMHHGGDPMRSPAGRSPFRGGGRRGGGPFRGGGGRGSFGNRPPRTDGSGPPSRGRGRGRGRGGGPKRHPPQSGSSSSHQEPSVADEAESSEEEAEPSADDQAQKSQAGSTVVARCETCKVDCNSLEILEQHNNGKRHKKNLQRLEELKSAYEPLTDSNPEETLLPENGQEGDENKPTLPESLPDEAGKDENKTESATNDQSKKPWMNRVDNQRHGMKRNMRGGPGGKRLKTFDTLGRRPIEPSKPKVVIPLICELCNVKCDTREVFNCHLSGKKHISKLKRFEGHQAMYGPAGLQALYPPNPISQTHVHPQGPPQAYHGPQGYPHPAHHAPPENPYPLYSGPAPQFVGQNSVHGTHQQVAPLGPEMNQVVAVQMYAGNGVNPPSGN